MTRNQTHQINQAQQAADADRAARAAEEARYPEYRETIRTALIGNGTDQARATEIVNGIDNDLLAVYAARVSNL